MRLNSIQHGGKVQSQYNSLGNAITMPQLLPNTEKSDLYCQTTEKKSSLKRVVGSGKKCQAAKSAGSANELPENFPARAKSPLSDFDKSFEIEKKNLRN
jgi:hypothetical protein